jgi:hypothetical protein
MVIAANRLMQNFAEPPYRSDVFLHLLCLRHVPLTPKEQARLCDLLGFSVEVVAAMENAVTGSPRAKLLDDAGEVADFYGIPKVLSIVLLAALRGNRDHLKNEQRSIAAVGFDSTPIP